MNQRPLTREELAWLLLDAHQKCTDLDRAEALSKLGAGKKWYAAGLIARYAISRARNGELS